MRLPAHSRNWAAGRCSKTESNTNMGYPMNRSFAYQETSITTASPEKLIIMLYEGAIRFLRQSANDIKTKNLVRKSQSIDRAMGIIQHPQSILDMDGGKDIARELDRL